MHGTPNTRFFKCFFPKLGGRKKVYLVWSNLYQVNYVLLVFLANQKSNGYLVFLGAKIEKHQILNTFFCDSKTPNNHEKMVIHVIFNTN